MKTPISRLEMSVRLKHACEEIGISTLEELLAIPEKELLSLRNFGRTSLAEVRTLRNTATGNIGLYGVIRSEIENALASQWYTVEEFLPPLYGDISEKVLIDNGEYHIAQFQRYKGWVDSSGASLHVKRWMKIPK